MLIRNTAANLAGQLLYPVLALMLVPFYIRHLGLEGYGLIGLMALVVSLLAVFSKGLGSALQREFGRRYGTDEDATLRRLLRSSEVVFWALAIVLGALLGVLAFVIGPDWVGARSLPPATVLACLVLLALRVSLAFPHSVYQSVFVGIQRQVLGNALNAAIALTSAIGGVVGVLAFRSVVAFYVSEVITAAVYLVVLRQVAFRVLPEASSRFDANEIRALLVISAALVWTNGIGLLIANLDRVFVSAALPVTSLAVYTVAVMGGRLVSLFYNPFLQAVYPRTCQIARSGLREEQARNLLHSAAVVAIIAAACGVPLALFSPEVLTVWVRDPEIARTGAPVMSIYVAGSVLIAFASVLYQWQMAIGQTRPAVRFNTIALVWFPLLLWLLVPRAALAGAAAAWAVYGLLTWLYTAGVTFRKEGLPDSRGPYARIVFLSLGAGVLISGTARYAADSMFTHMLWARVTCAVAAGALGGIAAIWLTTSRFGTRAGLLAGLHNRAHAWVSNRAT